jgi:hypothetical protein
MRQVTRDRVAKQRQRAAAATSAPTPARPHSRATAHKEEGPELVRPQTETVVKQPMVDQPVVSGVAHSELAPSEDFSRYAPRAVEVGIYGPIGASRAVIVYACCDIATRQLRWVDDEGEVLIEPPAATRDASSPSKLSDPYGGLGSYWHVATVAWASVWAHARTASSK